MTSASGCPLAPSFALYEVWDSAKSSSDFENRYADVVEFNSKNRFRKRGISMTPVRYEVSVWPKSCLVNVYGDGSIVVTHGGAEMGQGMNTKVAQMIAYEFGKLAGKVDMDLIWFNDIDTYVIPNGMFTGGSTGSE